jgi:hypothetical protein
VILFINYTTDKVQENSFTDYNAPSSETFRLQKDERFNSHLINPMFYHIFGFVIRNALTVNRL